MRVRRDGCAETGIDDGQRCVVAQNAVATGDEEQGGVLIDGEAPMLSATAIPLAWTQGIDVSAQRSELIVAPDEVLTIVV